MSFWSPPLGSHLHPTPRPQINYEITKLCESCVRGAYATKDMAPGDIVALVPFNVSISMPHGIDYAGVSSVVVPELDKSRPSLSSSFSPPSPPHLTPNNRAMLTY